MILVFVSLLSFAMPIYIQHTRWLHKRISGLVLIDSLIVDLAANVQLILDERSESDR